MSTNQRGFQVVRRGYDIDEVDAFLVHQAEAWGEALEESKAQVRSLEEEVASMRAASEERDRSEHELAIKLEEADDAVRQAREDAEREAADIVRTAQAEAAALSQEAEQARQAREVAELEKFEALQAELDVRHEDARERYGKAEGILKAKVEDLDATRQSLVAGLEAIARGGLSGLNTEAHEALAAVGLVDSTAVDAETSSPADDVEAEFESVDEGPAIETEAESADDETEADVDIESVDVSEADLESVDADDDGEAIAVGDVDHDADDDADESVETDGDAGGALEMPAIEAEVSDDVDRIQTDAAETASDVDLGDIDGPTLSDATETIDLSAAAPVSTFVNGNGTGHSNN